MCFCVVPSTVSCYVAIVQSTTFDRLVNYFDEIETELRNGEFIPGKVLLDLKVCNGEDAPNRYHIIDYDGRDLLDKTIRPRYPMRLSRVA